MQGTEIEIYAETPCPYCGKIQRINQWNERVQCIACGQFFKLVNEEWVKDDFVKTGGLA